jgi:formate dehydrogenase subunit gamma
VGDALLQEAVAAIVARHAAREGPLLPILQEVQAELGHVPDEAIRLVADALNLTRAEVHGVASFYHDFRSRPAPLPVLKICRAEACQARGVEALMPAAEAAAHGRVMLETVYCLGLCAVGPAAMRGDEVYARLDARALHVLIETTA